MVKTTGLASIAQGRSDIHQIDPRDLHVRPDWNVRDWDLQENKDHLERLAGSIAEVGVKDPLTVIWQDGKAWIDDGECRYRACMLAIKRGAPLKTVPCRAADRFADPVQRRFNRFLANIGKPFNPLETAKDFKYFIDQGWQQGDIAKRAGMSQGRVSQILDLLALPAPVKALVASGAVSTSLAAQVVRDQGKDAVQVLQKAAKEANGARIKPESVGRPNIKTAIFDAIEYSDIDDHADDVVVIKMPIDKWNVLRELLKL